MSDEYIAKLVEAELAETCPGERRCHGCVGWCPNCGDTGHVCDDPDCDTHRRESDVLKDISEVGGLARLSAAEAKKWETAVLADDTPQARGMLRGAAKNFLMYEKDLCEYEEELQEIRRPDSFLVPRAERDWRYRKGR